MVSKRARGKRSRSAGKQFPVGAVVSTFVDGQSCGSFLSQLDCVPRTGLVVKGGSNFEETSGFPGEFPMVERIEHDPEFSRFSRSEKVQNLPASASSSEVSAHQMARSETVPASGISSKLSAHQMAQSASCSTGLWSIRQSSRQASRTLSSEAWTEAAARDDHRKSLWNNESAAVTPAAQKKAQEEKVRVERDSKDNFLLAAIHKLAAFRTRLQKILYEGATARKDAEEDERSRWLRILAGIVQNTDIPMARLEREAREHPRARLFG